MKELIKYLPIENYIDGIQILGRDVCILRMIDKSEIEINNYDIIKIHTKVKEKLHEYHFSFLSNDKNTILILKEPYYNYGKTKAYELAFNEIIKKEQVLWSEIVDFNF